MTLHRFCVPPGAMAGGRAVLPGDAAHQVQHVLRMRAGERIILIDNSGWEYETELDAVSREAVSGRVIERRWAAAEPRTRITLHAALLKADKFEWVVQKCTELGVAAIRPLVSARCVRGEIGARTLERWRRIAREAAEQSGRGIVPEVGEPSALDAALRASDVYRLMLYEGEHARSLRAALEERMPGQGIDLFIGPEGGFDAAEVAQAQAAGVMPVTLGPRILRAETASVAAAAAVLFALGEMG